MKMSGQVFSDNDYAQMALRGIARERAEKQLEYFRMGFPAARLNRPAALTDGIMAIEEDAQNKYVQLFDKQSSQKKLLKFVPASGAATRMFKDVFAWQSKLSEGIDLDELIAADAEAAIFVDRIRDFASWDDLVLAMYHEDLDAAHLIEQKNLLPVLDFMLSEKGLDYASLPKGLIQFHRYQDHCRTALEEHMVEGALYARDGSGRVNIHFTVSPDHLEKFRARFDAVERMHAERLGVEFHVSYSIQKPSTDTLAVDPENQPFREPDGSLLFRPGGHGALLENLNELESDIIFIKNIDNVVPDHLKEQTVRYKKVVGGLLFEVQDKVHEWLHRIDSGVLSASDYTEACEFAVSVLHVDKNHFPPDSIEGTKVLHQMLNRPLRICGMVKNAGEPGGGPFWVEDPETGLQSLQIVETSQIDLNDTKQASILAASSHFNPVDLVVATRDYLGNAFDLSRFVDERTGFVSHKSKDGKPLKALELPGLWNGSMAGWITLFVEVPLITFNPVKVVNDLLRAEHQGI